MLPFFIDDKKVYFCGHKSLIFVAIASLATKSIFSTSEKCVLKVSTISSLKNLHARDLHRPSVVHPLFFLGVQIIHDVHG